MKIGDFVRDNEPAMKKYLYCRELGFSPETAELLAVLDYGDSELSALMCSLPSENRLKHLRAWLAEQPQISPQDAVLRRRGNLFQDTLTDIGPAGIQDAAALSMKASLPKPAAMARTPRRRMGSSKKLRDFFDTADAESGCAAPVTCAAPMLCEAGDPEDYATDSYELIEEKGPKNVLTAPTSTFRMTTNTASMGAVMNQLRSGRRPDLSQVRIEEILNYFDYDADEPREDRFAVSTELLSKEGKRKILYIHAQAGSETRGGQNIVLLLDVSGSMWGNRETTQMAIATVVSKLRAGDTFSLVTYSDTDRTVLDGYCFTCEEDRDELMAKVLEIEITGCTYGSAGIEQAYRLGAKHFRHDGVNQVILITDGDLNFGVTEKGGLKKLIEEQKKSGLFLSVIGTGLWNYRDDKLEVLAKNGNGTYCAVNCLVDVDESVNRRYVSLTRIVAKDVKAQVEFNPKYVKRYRLLGYENRELNHEDFADDTVISEPYGSGGHGVALYELEMADGMPQSDLKYVRPVLNGSNELCTVKLRWKEPLSERSHELSHPVPMRDASGKNVQLAYFLYCASEQLRNSDRLDEYDRSFLKIMLTSELYKNYAGRNGEKLEVFAAAVK